MRSRTRLAALAAVAPVLLAGCGHGAQAGAVELVGNIETLHPGSLSSNGVSAAQQRFALDLMARTCGQDGANTLLSPASAADALGLLDASAHGSTATAMAAMLHLPVWSPEVVAAIHAHEQALDALSTGSGDTLRTSNRIWPAVGDKPTPPYLDDVRTAYGASVRSLDYARHPQQATDAINRQVSKDTDGLIPTLFDSPLDPSTVATLTNAMVLKATWLSPLQIRAATSAFTTSTGHTAQAWLMDSVSPVSYDAAGGWQAAQIPYTSGTMAAVAILPPKGSRPCALPTAAELSQLTGAGAGRTNLSLPRMHLDQTHQLARTLETMGLPAGGDYSGLGGSVVSEVVQTDVMTVDEAGTVAAAATGVAVGASAESPPAAVHQLTFDRPFLLLLEDTATHTPLFLASIGDASST